MSDGTPFAVCDAGARGTAGSTMRNTRTIAVAVLAFGSVLAWPLGWAPSGTTSEAHGPPSEPAVVVANAQVGDAIDLLRSGELAGPVTVVRVTGTQLQELLRDDRFLGNVHALQDFLNNDDAGGLQGVDVSITDVLALEVRRDGGAVLFTR
jgi:hypothetical protein